MTRSNGVIGAVAVSLALTACGGSSATQQVSTVRRLSTDSPIQSADLRAQPFLEPATPMGGRPSGDDGEVALPTGPRAPVLTVGPVVPSSPVAGAVAAGPPSGPPPPGAPVSPAANVYAATLSGTLAPAVAGVTPRVYVPNSVANTMTVIDPATMAVIETLPMGKVPHHVTPAWDLSRLYVNNTQSDSLTEIDPRTGQPGRTIPVQDPYNLYFTPDGSKAIVVAERFERLDFRDPRTWALIKSVPIPFSGADHLDFSADGGYLMVSTEFSGKVVKVDTRAMAVAGVADVGGLPVDVKLAPDGSVFFVANQGRHGVSVVDPQSMREVGFVPTGRGAHGLYFSRDTGSLYVSNRLEGTISVIDVASRQVRATWRVGGSPDMIQLNPDGSQLWVSGRYNGNVMVVDTTTGGVVKVIPTGTGAHGLSFFPAPGHFSVGHNGVYR
jgi:YVTN family beta-propeller protein